MKSCRHWYNSLKVGPLFPLKYNSLRRVGCRCLVSILLLVLFATASACTHPVRRLVFQPHMINFVPDFPQNMPGLERFWLQSEEGRVEGWLLERKGVSISLPGPAVMIAHGNRELIGNCLDRAIRYRDMGFTVLLGEYRGYGRSEGTSSREGIRADYIQFYDKLASLPGVDPSRIVFHGRSLGGSVLADLVPYRRPAALILESTFTSIKAMAHGAPEFLLSDTYDALSAISAYDGPVQIIHGTRDQVVPVAHAHELKRQVPRAVLLLGDFGHNDLAVWRGPYWSSIFGFLKEHHLILPDL